VTGEATREDALYDLLTIGLLHHAKAEPTKVGCQAHVIFGALWQTRLWPRYFTTPVRDFGPLRNRVQLASHMMRVTVIQESKIRAEATVTEQPLLMVVNARKGDYGMLNYTRILGPGGYRIVLCERGKVYAQEAHERYPQLTLDEFQAGLARFGGMRQQDRNV
jgi:hypothetical protein